MSREFTGTDRVVFGTTDNVPATSYLAATAISFAAWIKVTTWGSTFPRAASIGIVDATTRTTFNFQASNPSMRLERGAGTSGSATDTSLDDGTWHQLVWVSDGTNEQFWLDGVQLSNSATAATSDETRGQVLLGNVGGSFDRVLGGQLAYPQMYNRALSSTDIGTLQTVAWLESDPDCIFLGNADCDADAILSLAGTITGTTLHASDNPPVTEPGAGGTTELVVTRDALWSVRDAVTATRALLWNVEVPVLAAPTNLVLAGRTTTTISMAWNDNAADETGYVVERSADELDWTVVSNELAANATTFTDSDLAQGATWHYRVRGFKDS